MRVENRIQKSSRMRGNNNASMSSTISICGIVRRRLEDAFAIECEQLARSIDVDARPAPCLPHHTEEGMGH